MCLFVLTFYWNFGFTISGYEKPVFLSAFHENIDASYDIFEFVHAYLLTTFLVVKNLTYSLYNTTKLNLLDSLLQEDYSTKFQILK